MNAFYTATLAAFAAGTLEQKMIDKLSTGKIGCTPERAKIEGKAVDILLVFGQVNGIKTGVDKRNGQEWQALKGEFYAVRTDAPGTAYKSGLLFLPAGQDAFETAVVTGELDDNDKPVYGRLEFAVMVVAVPATNARGYSWELHNLIDAGRPPEDSLQARLVAKMQTKLAALPAPDKADEKADKKGKAA